MDQYTQKLNAVSRHVHDVEITEIVLSTMQEWDTVPSLGFHLRGGSSG